MNPLSSQDQHRSQSPGEPGVAAAECAAGHPRLSELANQLAAAVVATDAEDLPALAALHDQLQNVGRLAAELGLAVAGTEAVAPLATDASRLVERLILREAEDASACLREVRQAVAQLQSLVSGDPVVSAEKPAAPADNSTAALPAPAQAPSAEQLGVETCLSPEDAPMAVEFITEARGHIETAEAELLKLEERPDNPDALGAIFRAFHTIKGVAGFLNLKQIGALAHAAESMLDLARRGELKLAGAATDLVLEAIDQMKLLIGELDQAVRNQRAMAVQPGLPALLDRLRAYASGGAVETESTAPAAKTEVVAAPTAGEKAEARPAAASNATADATVKVATDRLDSLINMVGELVIAESMVQQDVAGLLGDNQRIGRNVAHLGKITRSMQELSMSMRMVPIQGCFRR